LSCAIDAGKQQQRIYEWHFSTIEDSLRIYLEKTEKNSERPPDRKGAEALNIVRGLATDYTDCTDKTFSFGRT
jgi:hypothetical protein